MGVDTPSSTTKYIRVTRVTNTNWFLSAAARVDAVCQLLMLRVDRKRGALVGQVWRSFLCLFVAHICFDLMLVDWVTRFTWFRFHCYRIMIWFWWWCLQVLWTSYALLFCSFFESSRCLWFASVYFHMKSDLDSEKRRWWNSFIWRQPYLTWWHQNSYWPRSAVISSPPSSLSRIMAAFRKGWNHWPPSIEVIIRVLVENSSTPNSFSKLNERNSVTSSEPGGGSLVCNLQHCTGYGIIPPRWRGTTYLQEDGKWRARFLQDRCQ